MIFYYKPESSFLCVVRPSCVAKTCLFKGDAQPNPNNHNLSPSIFHLISIHPPRQSTCHQQKTNAKLRAKPSTYYTKYPPCLYVFTENAISSTSRRVGQLIPSPLFLTFARRPFEHHTNIASPTEHKSGQAVAIILCLSHRKWCKSRCLGCECFSPGLTSIVAIAGIASIFDQ